MTASATKNMLPILAQAVPDYMGDGSDDQNDRNSDSDEYEDDTPQYRYITEHGRKYLDRDEVYLPTDSIEARRQNLQHCLIKMLFNQKLFFAPIKNPSRILDIGTGTGKWVQEVARMFPKATVIGSDIHPLVDTEVFPSNVEIVSEDANEGDFGDKPYSFIHTRYLLGCFSDFASIINTSYKYLEPGGWMECHELWPVLYTQDKDPKPNSKLKEWSRLIDQAFMELDRPIRTANKIKGWMEKAGFVDVKEDVYQLPLNQWPRDPSYKMIGKYNSISFKEGLSGFSLRAFNSALGWSMEETEVYLSAVKEELSDPSHKFYFNVYVVLGRKPEDAQMQPLGANDPSHRMARLNLS